MSQTMQGAMSEAITEVAQYTERLLIMGEQTNRARRDETDCRNRLNQAQKKVDELIATLKKQAPRDSDWKRETFVAHTVSITVE